MVKIKKSIYESFFVDSKIFFTFKKPLFFLFPWTFLLLFQIVECIICFHFQTCKNINKQKKWKTLKLKQKLNFRSFYDSSFISLLFMKLFCSLMDYCYLNICNCHAKIKFILYPFILFLPGFFILCSLWSVAHLQPTPAYVKAWNIY